MKYESRSKECGNHPRGKFQPQPKIKKSAQDLCDPFLHFGWLDLDCFLYSLGDSKGATAVGFQKDLFEACGKQNMKRPFFLFFVFFFLCYKGLLGTALYITVIVVKRNFQILQLEASFILFLSKTEGKLEDSWSFFEFGVFLLYSLPQRTFYILYLFFSSADGLKTVMGNNRKEIQVSGHFQNICLRTNPTSLIQTIKKKSQRKTCLHIQKSLSEV